MSLTAATPPTSALDDPSLYLNRELSWLAFNRRVLEEALDPTVLLLERLKFAAIFSSNLDEFFMVRVGGLQQKVHSDILVGSGADRMPPGVLLDRIGSTVRELLSIQAGVLQEEILPALKARGISIRRTPQLTADDRKNLRAIFQEQIFIVLTPLAIDTGHPFPQLLNKSLNIAVVLRRPGDPDPLYAVVQVPGMLSRFVPLPGEAASLVPLEDVIRLHIHDLFPGMELCEAFVFRVTRDSEVEIDDEADDLMQAIEESVRKRKRGHAVRLELENSAPADIEQLLVASLDLHSSDCYRIDGLVDPTGYFQLLSLPGFADLRDPPFNPIVVREFSQASSPWAAIRAKDILVHHPYESFKPVVDFIEAAAGDERVLAIKQTLYRTSSDSPIVRALQQAADRGKQVTAVIELKARLDEERNILWAKEMEKAGVHVVFGFVGLKTHCKVALVVRRDEDNALRRYVHLGTGNYNPQTARIYTDIGFFTCRVDFADDVSALFNYLTGYAQLPQWRKLVVAPSRLQSFIIERIDAETMNMKAGKKARIVAKVNGLLDPVVIQALYRASQAGVPIEIICRGICALRPGVPGLSETIRITSVVDRFLEHSRIYYFENEGDPQVYVGSADWMDRNLIRRVEVVFPVEQADLKARVIDEILQTSLLDNVKARVLQSDGTYVRAVPVGGEATVRSQVRFLELAAKSALAAPTPAPAPPEPPKPSRRGARKKPGGSAT
ncbi:MAG: polyphosphate kinase 1 [Gemmataceae bacterium]